MIEPRKAPVRVVICGAAGRDYHTFNRVYRNSPGFNVVAFTATQIPGIEGRRYPPDLAGPGYPQGIPIYSQSELPSLIARHEIDRVVFAYSDVSSQQVMDLAATVIAAGAEWVIHGPAQTMCRSRHPVVAVSAVRTGCGKSQVARYLSTQLRAEGRRVVVIRHPMPYGSLASSAVQRFATAEDLDLADCTLEEREEYEPHIAAGNVVFAGVDYERIVEAADKEADLIIWDGGNNDFPFVAPDLHIVVTDALRPEHVTGYFPGEAVLRMAGLVIINKINAASPETVVKMQSAIERIVPGVPVMLAESVVRLDSIPPRGTAALIVDDGPTLTHGGMAFGAGYQAAQEFGLQIIDPRRSATPMIQQVYSEYPHIGPVLPAMGYSAKQRDALRRTINDSDAEIVIAGTPIDLARDVGVDKPVIRAHYDYLDHDDNALMNAVHRFLEALPG